MWQHGIWQSAGQTGQLEETHGDAVIVRNNTHKAGLDLEVCAVTHRYLGGSPVDPSFAIGVDVEQDQTLHQVREDQLREDEAETNVRL